MFHNPARSELRSYDRIWLHDLAHEVRTFTDGSGRLPILADSKYLVVDGRPPIAEERCPEGAEVIDGA